MFPFDGVIMQISLLVRNIDILIQIPLNFVSKELVDDKSAIVLGAEPEPNHYLDGWLPSLLTQGSPGIYDLNNE